MSPSETWSHGGEATSRNCNCRGKPPPPEMWLQSRKRVGKNNLSFPLTSQSPASATYQLYPAGNQLQGAWVKLVAGMRDLQRWRRRKTFPRRKGKLMPCTSLGLFCSQSHPSPALLCPVLYQRIAFCSLLCPWFLASMQPMGGHEGRL